MHFSILVTNDRKMWAHIALIAAVKSIVLLQSSVYVHRLVPTWRNGYAAACRAAYPGSIPGVGLVYLFTLPGIVDGRWTTGQHGAEICF